MKDEPTWAPLRASIRTILERANNYDWTVQGFGMLRTYLDKDKTFRLNVWDQSLAVPGVSTIHDHPWTLKSWIINGRLVNSRFIEDSYSGDELSYMVIKTGEGGGPDDSRNGVRRMRVRMLPLEFYQTGDVYEQTPTEIHESCPKDGCVSLNERHRVGDGEHARVFWPYGTEWVDAEPRKASILEVARVTERALSQWE